MLLRSSSTPILGSLLSTSSTPDFSESPNTTHHQLTTLQSFSCRFSPLDDNLHALSPTTLTITTNGGGGYNPVLTDHNGGNKFDLEMYHKRMVEEDPSNALFLRNYANFLYQTKGDIQRAEEYYSRAILAEPGDGDILSQYAKLVRELHHDEERASSYFKLAVQAAPQDSHVQADYAGFLWETEDDYGVGEIDEQSQDNDGPSMVNREFVASGTM